MKFLDYSPEQRLWILEGAPVSCPKETLPDLDAMNKERLHAELAKTPKKATET
jgi:hypothetical protein